MHSSWSISRIVKKDKKLILVLSTYSQPIQFPCVPYDIVPRRSDNIQENIFTTSMHLEYTTHIRGVGVVDHLTTLYLSLDECHKWSHRI